MDLNIGKEVAAMKRMTVNELRGKYAEVFGEGTNARHKEWLVRRIAWRIPPGDFQRFLASAVSTISLAFIGSLVTSSTIAAASSPLTRLGLSVFSFLARDFFSGFWAFVTGLAMSGSWQVLQSPSSPNSVPPPFGQIGMPASPWVSIICDVFDLSSILASLVAFAFLPFLGVVSPPTASRNLAGDLMRTFLPVARFVASQPPKRLTLSIRICVSLLVILAVYTPPMVTSFFFMVMFLSKGVLGKY